MERAQWHMSRKPSILRSLTTRSQTRTGSSSSGTGSQASTSRSGSPVLHRTTSSPALLGSLATPGPQRAAALSAARQRAFPAGSPNTTAQLPALRRSLFGSPQRNSVATQQPAPQETPVRPTARSRQRIVSTPPRRSSSRSMSGSQGGSRRGSQHNTPNNSPERRRRVPAPPELQEQLTQLTQTVNAFVLAQARAAPQCAQVNSPEQPPPDFHWNRLLQPSPTNFPAPTEVQVQHIATGLLTKLPLLTGQDHHEVQFVVSMLSDYQHLPEELANLVYQRANLLSIAVHHGWHNAIAASATSTPASAILQGGVSTAAKPACTPALRTTTNPGTAAAAATRSTAATGPAERQRRSSTRTRQRTGRKPTPVKLSDTPSNYIIFVFCSVTLKVCKF